MNKQPSKTDTAIGCFALLFCLGIIAAITGVQGFNPFKPQSQPQVSELSTKASQLQEGMTLQQVKSLLGRQPDAVTNDATRQKRGEMATGLTTFEWSNSDCVPVSVDFKGNAVSGWNEGRLCPGSTRLLGESCQGNALCD